MVTIRPEQPGDVAAIHAVHVACFPTDAEARLVQLLRATGQLTVTLVAEVADHIVGHLAFSPVTTAAGAVGMGLAPVSVLPMHQRQGIAAGLIEQGLKQCHAAGYGWVVVLGEPAYYARFGFQPAGDYGLSDEYGGGAAFQVLELTAGHMPHGAGFVRYAPAFASLVAG